MTWFYQASSPGCYRHGSLGPSYAAPALILQLGICSSHQALPQLCPPSCCSMKPTCQDCCLSALHLAGGKHCVTCKFLLETLTWLYTSPAHILCPQLVKPTPAPGDLTMGLRLLAAAVSAAPLPVLCAPGAQIAHPAAAWCMAGSGGPVEGGWEELCTLTSTKMQQTALISSGWVKFN